MAGFEGVVALEKDRWACDTLERNRNDGFALLNGVKVVRGDVRDFDYSALTDIDLVSGGPPCQPFSVGGKGKAFNDDRDMFNAFADSLAALRPRAFIVENVKGLTRPALAEYLRYIEHRMSVPEMRPHKGEKWPDHLARVEHEMLTGADLGVRYRIHRKLYNAADMGVPQKRERVFFIGFREDQNVDWCFPETTHSLNALMRDQWVTGDYWDRHRVAEKDRPERPVNLRVREEDGKLPWVTVRDALLGLPEPQPEPFPVDLPNHRFQPGAKVYPGHTGSPIDLPAKALKAGDHGVPGGENMLLRPDGSVRYFSVREAARLQTFPDDYVFQGSWGETMRQLGNAVPVMLARSLAVEVFKKLNTQSV